MPRRLAIVVALGLAAAAATAAPPPDPFAQAASGDAKALVASLAEDYRAGRLDPWVARLYQDLRLEAGERAALLEETRAAYPDPKAPLGGYLLARLAERKDLEAFLQRCVATAPDPVAPGLDQAWAALAAERTPAATAALARVRKAAGAREEAVLVEAAIEDAQGRRAVAERVLAGYVAAHVEAADARAAWAATLHALRRDADAVAVLEDGLSRGRSVPLLVARAELALDMGDLPVAGKLAEEAKGRGRPASRARSLAVLAACRLAARDVAGAQTLADEAGKAAPLDELALRVRARCADAAGRPADAVRLLDDAIDARPGSVRPYVDKAFLLLRERIVKEARKVAAEARRRDPDDVDVQVVLGALEEEDLDWSTAERAYRNVLRLAPDHVLAHRLLAGVSFQLGRLDQADEAAAWVLARDEKDAPSWFVRGRVAYKRDRFDDALAHFDRALAADPTYGLAHCGKGWVYEQQDRNDDARKAYEAAIAADPRLPLPHRDLGEVLEILDEPRKARDAYRKYLELGGADPDSDVQRSVERLSK